VHSHLAALSAFAASDQHPAASAVEVELDRIERLWMRRPARQSAAISRARVAVEAVAATAHHGDDLFGARQVGG
jgi:hypothetical protein